MGSTSERADPAHHDGGRAQDEQDGVAEELKGRDRNDGGDGRNTARGN